ncbi:MAG: hypothetical protein GAK37_03608 [Pseudomonas sp.]|nr:MAG: hypothetical protein GAK37_03608 [Pseudomonas sp.]
MTLTASPARGPVADAITVQFAAGPTLATVARRLLGESIAQACPGLVIDLSRTQLATPEPGGGWTLQPFMPWVQDTLVNGTPPDLSDRDAHRCFLTDKPPIPMKLPGNQPLNMQVIEEQVRALAWTLPVALQNTLADYWSAPSDTGVPRWRWLSDVLTDAMTIGSARQTDLTAHERDMLGQLVDYPDRDPRITRFGEQAVHAYCPQAILQHGQHIRNLLGPDLILLCSAQGQSRVLLCPPAGTCERFTDVQVALQAWAKRMTRTDTLKRITLQRFEPDGNVFDMQAATLLNQQLQQLGALKLPSTQGMDTLQAAYKQLTDPATALADSQADSSPATATLRNQMPDWIQNAPKSGRASYRHYSLKLASAKKRSQGRTFLSGIDDLQTFTRTALLKQLKRDESRFDKILPEHTRSAQFLPEDLQLTFSVAAGYPGGAGFVDKVRMSLTDLAIHNLHSQPGGQLSVVHRSGLPLPAWLTPDYINAGGGLIQHVNIGKVYPELLKTRLLGNSEDARQRERDFAAHTAAQLPLQALELSLKQERGFTPTGADYVAALLAPATEQRQVDGQAVVIRHLALVRKPGAAADVVANMYIIEADNGQTGPHILYRPLYADALQQFPTRQALLAAMASPGDLQASVLTWLHDTARPIYAHGGFLEPHYVRFGQGDEFDTPEVPQPAALASDGVSDELLQFLSNGQLMQYLYGCNARALVDQADREAVSNAESRWAVFLQGASLLFNTLLLPLTRGPFMLAGWLLSLMAALDRDIPDLDSQDPVTRELALVDLLLNVGMLMFEQLPSATPEPLKVAADAWNEVLNSPFAQRFSEQWPAPAEPELLQGPVLLENAGAQLNDTVFDFSFSSARNRLTPNQNARLWRLQAPKPDVLPQPVRNGPRQGLYHHLRDWYAVIDARWYQVRLEPEGGVVIVDPFDISRQGPALQSDGHGNWSLDLKLRLNGGMPPKRIAAERERKTLRKQQLEHERTRFLNPGEEMRQGRRVTVKSLQQALQDKVDIAQQLMNTAASDPKYSDAARANTRKNFDAALHVQNAAYTSLLVSRQERSALGIPIPADVTAILLENTVNNTRKSVVVADMDRQALYAANSDFTVPYAEALPAILSNPGRYTQFLKDMSQLNERQIQALELKDRYLLELFNLGPAGLEGYNRLTEGRPDEVSALALKYLQIQNYKYLSKKYWQSGLFSNVLDTVLDPLGPHLRTHSELNTLNLPAADRLDVLDSLFQQYGQAVDALQGMALVNAEQLDMPYFQRTQVLIESLYLDVMQQLAAEVKPPADVAMRPSKRPLSVAGKPLKESHQDPPPRHPDRRGKTGRHHTPHRSGRGAFRTGKPVARHLLATRKPLGYGARRTPPFPTGTVTGYPGVEYRQGRCAQAVAGTGRYPQA